MRIADSVALGRSGSSAASRSTTISDAAASGFRDDERVVVFYEGQATEFAMTARGTVAAAGSGAITAPMPGRVSAVEVSVGENIAKGQRLLTLEAMKMEHALVAPFDGVVAELAAEAGAQVGEGAVLARIEAEPSPA